MSLKMRIRWRLEADLVWKVETAIMYEGCVQNWRLQGSAPVTTGYRPPSEATALAEQLQRSSAVIIGPYRLLRRKL